VIEFDGWRAHSSRGSFVHDRRRQNRLVAAGYVVLRFTWDDLMEQPGEVVRQIRLAASRLAA
jgi:very-short-patch-repair endonuclease